MSTADSDRVADSGIRCPAELVRLTDCTVIACGSVMDISVGEAFSMAPAAGVEAFRAVPVGAGTAMPPIADTPCPACASEGMEWPA